MTQHLRIVVTTCILATVLIVVALAVRGAEPTSFLLVLSFVAGIVVTPLAASPFEWLVHRHVYHRPRRYPLNRIYTIHQAHHFAYFPTWRYVTGGAPRRIRILGERIEASSTGWVNGLTRSAHFAFYFVLGLLLICGPVYFLSRSVALLAGTLVGLVIISDLFIRVHDAIHRPAAHPLLQRQRWFQFLDEHHFVHHVDLDANVNFLLPLADLMYGTLRRSLTEPELEKHGTLHAAKVRAVGFGEPVNEQAESSDPPQNGPRQIPAEAM